jgi:hypothetical protein
VERIIELQEEVHVLLIKIEQHYYASGVLDKEKVEHHEEKSRTLPDRIEASFGRQI